MSFIHFGCWNKGLCQIKNIKDVTVEDLAITKVMSKIKDVVETENVEFISVAGDNYYPEKTKFETGTKKIIKQSELESGFQCLPQDVDVHIILGNHDLETNSVNSPSKPLMIEDNDGTQIKELKNECSILQMELDIVQQIQTKSESETNQKSKLHFEFNRVLKIGNTVILMIDSSIYEDDADVQEYLPCYQKMNIYDSNNNINEVVNIQQLREIQFDFIVNSLIKHMEDGTQTDNIIIIGHHPITGHKLKKNKQINIAPFPPFINMWIELSKTQLTLDKRLYYLCADLHLYQEGNVAITYTSDNEPQSTLLIHQHIVGTGGTTLDHAPNADTPSNDTHFLEPILEFNSNKTNILVEYQYSSSIESHGFLKCFCGTKANEKPIFEFINTDEIIRRNILGGQHFKRTKKWKKYQRKTLKKIKKTKHSKKNKKTRHSKKIKKQDTQKNKKTRHSKKIKTRHSKKIKTRGKM
jgi:hypothetical protein